MSHKSNLWSERHRPRSLSECVLTHLRSDVREILLKSEQTGEPFNFLFYGPPGTGKTTIAEILCDESRHHVFRRNGWLVGKSDAKSFAGYVTTTSLRGLPKCILIDEVDAVTSEGQSGLRALMDLNVPVSWIFTSNHPERLDKGILSRVIQVACSRPSALGRATHINSIVERCQQILRLEKIADVPSRLLYEIANEAYPDIRKAVNDVQVAVSHRIPA